MAWNGKGKVTRRERFLAEMDAVIPWLRLVRLIGPHYPKTGQGRQPLGLEKMLRIYFLQQWFNLSDPQAEDAIYDSESMRRFVRIELGDEVMPDETTILPFRHLLEQRATTTTSGKQIPPPTPEFGGVIKERASESKAWWAPRVVPPKGAPNVLLIMTDEVGFGAPSTFGGVIPTPTLDRIAAEGLRYTSFNSTGLCSPTRVDVGEDTRTGVAMVEYRYDVPFKFTGKIDKLTFKLKPFTS